MGKVCSLKENKIVIIKEGKMFIKKIMIDLDGVLNEYGKEPFDENYIPEIKSGVEKFLKELKTPDTDLYLFTTRNLLLAAKWLERNKIDKYFKDVTNVKSMAYLYIDDRAIRFDGDFSKTINEIKNFRADWKKAK